MILDSIEPPLPMGSGDGSRFSSLRGVQWRIDLGILPCSLSSSIEDLRRVAADSRRRYASLRRRLLIDPHTSKDGNRSSDLAKDNPLSQNPDSMWGRFFRNAELEKMVDQDLSRLYPEHGGYFQTPACQTMLRRILLLWCLRNPEYGYRQGMHELLAPLLYVLHVDLHHLSEMKVLYRDYFNDDFDENSSPERDIDGDDSSRFNGTTPKAGNLDELDPITRDIFLLSDAYGAEGELGVVLSERFMEHDAYCMFDSLMSGGARGAVATADFFSSSPPIGPSNGIPPVIEASAALYHLLSIVDSSLHCHLIELGVEPQYFALRWLRVLFGREFSLDDLLVVWDELFSSLNSKLSVGDSNSESGFGILCSPRGAFISATAVAMLLHMRSSLFATENATSCLQRLLNFPRDINVKKLIEKAKSLQALALEANVSSFSAESCKDKTKPGFHRGRSLSSDSASPQTPLYTVPDSYWEEKWRVMQREEEATKQGSHGVKKSSGGILKGSLVQRFGLSRTESDPSPGKIVTGEKNSRISVRHRLLDDLAPNVGKRESDEVLGVSRSKDLFPSTVSDEGKHFHGAPEDQDINGVHSLSQRTDPPFMLDDGEPDDQNTNGRTSDCTAEETSLCLSGDNSSVFSSATSPQSTGHDEENASEKSSITSNSFIGENEEEVNHVEEISNAGSESSPLQDTEEVIVPVESQPVADNPVKHEAVAKDRRPVSGKFQWFWKIGRGSGDGNADRSSIAGDARRDIRREEEGDKKVKGQSVGQSMLENIKVIESVFEQDQGGPAGKVAAMAALEELRKISELLSEM